MLDSLYDLVIKALAIVVGAGFVLVAVLLVAGIDQLISAVLSFLFPGDSPPAPAAPAVPYQYSGGFAGLCDHERSIRARLNQQATTAHQ
jgi:hypothetical protein